MFVYLDFTVDLQQDAMIYFFDTFKVSESAV
jgi:hypothetical protein